MTEHDVTHTLALVRGVAFTLCDGLKYMKRDAYDRGDVRMGTVLSDMHELAQFIRTTTLNVPSKKGADHE